MENIILVSVVLFMFVYLGYDIVVKLKALIKKKKSKTSFLLGDDVKYSLPLKSIESKTQTNRFHENDEKGKVKLTA